MHTTSDAMTVYAVVGLLMMMRVMLDPVAGGGGRIRRALPHTWLTLRRRTGLLLLRQHGRHFRLLLRLLLQVNFGMTFLLVAACELTPANVARKRLLARMRAYVRG